MEDIVDTKGIERVVEAPKPKKPRSQAQKEAFEKARQKRAENLARKKEEEELEDWAEDEVDKELPPVKDIKPPPKKRGRPAGTRKIMNRRPEPPAQQFISPPDPQLYGQYPVMGQNPYPYYQPPPQPQQQPVNNYYYYGSAPPQEPREATEEPEFKNETILHAQPEPQYGEESSEEEEIDYPAQPQLKFRFA